MELPYHLLDFVGQFVETNIGHDNDCDDDWRFGSESEDAMKCLTEKTRSLLKRYVTLCIFGAIG